MSESHNTSKAKQITVNLGSASTSITVTWGLGTLLMVGLLGLLIITPNIWAFHNLNAKLNTVLYTSQSVTRDINDLQQLVSAKTTEDIIFLKIMILQPRISPALAATIAKHVYKYSREFNRDTDLILAMIAVESNFNPNAVSNKGAIGLMQVMSFWRKELGIKGDLKDIGVSIKSGLQILAYYEQQFKNIDIALLSYNTGPEEVNRMIGAGLAPRTEYVSSIMVVFNRLKRLQSISRT